jgi:hypothetical protein
MKLPDYLALASTLISAATLGVTLMVHSAGKKESDPKGKGGKDGKEPNE